MLVTNDIYYPCFVLNLLANVACINSTVFDEFSKDLKKKLKKSIKID